MPTVHSLRFLPLLFALLMLACGPERAQSGGATQGTPEAHTGTPETLTQLRDRLLQEQDTDGDRRLTVLDQPSAPFVFTMDDLQLKLDGAAELHALLEELTLALRKNQEQLEVARLLDDPVTRLSRAIRERYWHSLTRRI